MWAAQRSPNPDDDMANASESLIRRYYSAFNERRLDAAAKLFSDDAVLEQVLRPQRHRGGNGYLQFAEAWLSAFPDAVLTVQSVVARDISTHEIGLVATGTHSGPLDLGGWIFKPTNAAATLNLREVLEIRDGRIVFSGMSFDLHQMVEQLSRVDCPKLLQHVERIRQLGDELAGFQGDATRIRDVLHRLGFELDAARHVVRPYFKR